MYSEFIANPSLERLNAAYLQLCSDVTDGKGTLILDDQCFTVIQHNQVAAQFCFLKGLSYPTDNASLISQEILPGHTLELFDNNTDQFDPALLPTNQTFVRAFIIWVQYPKNDLNGETVVGSTKFVTVTLENYDEDTFDIPTYNLFAHTANPVTTDATKIINSLRITNPQAYPVCVKALLIYTKSDDASINQNDCNC